VFDTDNLAVLVTVFS